MQDNNKKGNSVFLDKFKGRANKVDKNGLNHALDPIHMPSPPRKDIELPARRKKLASLNNSSHSGQQSPPRVDLDELIPSNPQSKAPYISKRSGNSKITPKKQDYVPSLYDPLKTSSVMPPSPQTPGLHLPPSRSISDKSENLHRRIFGKYLKLDDEAKRHLQFLQQLNKNRPPQKHSNSFAQ